MSLIKNVRRVPRVTLAIIVLLTTPFVLAQTPTAPEAASSWIDKDLAHAAKDMVVAANPLAVEAGIHTLARGGTAVDAAIAVQLVLNLVEPQSSGIGGGAFLLHHDAASQKLEFYDGRETAPEDAKPDLFIGEDGKPLPFLKAVNGGRSVGTPGLLRMLALAHRDHGRLPWALLFLPAINHALDGFAISPRMHAQMARDSTLCEYEPARSYFCDKDGAPKATGAWLRNPEFADTLLQIGFGGVERFYEGPIAQDMVDAVRSHATNPGTLSLSDLAGYRPIKREPLCGRYRTQWRVCGTNMPSSGGATMLQTLGILENFDLASLEPNSVEAVHLVSEAYRLAYADRAKYMADSDFVTVPTAALLDKVYLKSRAALIDRKKSLGVAPAGSPPGADSALGEDTSPELPSTSHISIVDRWGNVVAMTTTIENAFGSKILVRGFLLNNQMTDFSFSPTDSQGKPIANRVEPGKRPRSSLAPTIVFDYKGRPRIVAGSPGGSGIIQYVTKTLIGVLDWNLDMQQAVSLPHFGAQTSATTVLEKDTSIVSLKAELEALGHTVSVVEQNSGLGAIVLNPDSDKPGNRLSGGADPRREGVAKGDSPALELPRLRSVAPEEMKN